MNERGKMRKIYLNKKHRETNESESSVHMKRTGEKKQSHLRTPNKQCTRKTTKHRTKQDAIDLTFKLKQLVKRSVMIHRSRHLAKSAQHSSKEYSSFFTHFILYSFERIDSATIRH